MKSKVLSLEELSDICGYDITTEESRKSQGLKSVQYINLVSTNGKPDNSWKPRLLLQKEDGTEITFDIDVDAYYLKVKRQKLEKIIKNIKL